MLGRHKNARLCALFAASLLIAGCESFARGVTNAVLRPDEDQIRQCTVEGAPFDGVHAIFEKAQPSRENRKTLRMLIVHGIGPHIDNYSDPFVDQFADQLGLNHRSAQKRLRMTSAARTFVGVLPRGELGPLLITRHTNRDQSRELLVFEVNWSAFNAREREQLAAIDAAPKGYQASINAQVKAFFNQQVVDPIRYVGESSPEIRAYVRQATCWMVSLDWDEYPTSDGAGAPSEICPVLAKPKSEWEPKVREIIARDSFVAVTHSLGSRIFLDAFSIHDAPVNGDINPFVPLANAFSDKDITLVMLANQLPLLQLGLDDRGVPANSLAVDLPADEFVPWRNGERYSEALKRRFPRSAAPVLERVLPTFKSAAALCARPGFRRFRQMSVITVNDPNDLLSYRMTEDYKRDYIDWALCPKFTDVTIEVAQPTNIFGLSFANPGDAHGNYWDDPGLNDILLRGFGDGAAGAPDDRFAPRLQHAVDADVRGRKILYRCDGRFRALD